MTTRMLPSSAAPSEQLTRLAGWGANVRVDCIVRQPETPQQVAAVVARARSAASFDGAIARGLGRSYGDAALNGGGLVVSTTGLNRYLAFDADKGWLSCEAGISLSQIIHDFAPRGWFPVITPGTKWVTVGGCIANDIHGKAHHVQGSFSNSVESMTMLMADGNVKTVSRTEHADLFWGTFGGMGLLGIVISATLRLRRIETTYFRQKVVRVNDLEEMMAVLDEANQDFPYSVATLDVFATGARLGRGVVALGDHETRDRLPPKLALHPLRISGPAKITVPFELPELTLNSLSIRALNAVVQEVQAHASSISHYDSFLFPLDVIEHWNRGYGRRGFTQYQFVIPLSEGHRRMRDILNALLSAGELPFLNVLKRLGRESQGPLSFPREGYTLAIDFPIRARTIELLRKVDALVLQAGGRVYLGKDAYLAPEMFRAMYPQHERFLALKAKYDPQRVFQSNLARRLRLA